MNTNDIYDELQRIHFKLDRITRFLVTTLGLEINQMSLADDILAKVTEADTKVDSMIAFLEGLKNEGTIPQATFDAIIAKVQGSEDKIDAALGANTTPTP